MSLVAIVGRPNVGKSTLFNRLVESREAIVHNEPGVTRDRHYGSVIWNGVSFSLVDTGGWVPDSEDRFEAAIREQVSIAIDESDLVLFVVDVTAGITDLDDAIAKMLRVAEKNVMIVANKSDNPARSWEAPVFYSLGLGEVYPLSSINGTGTGDFLDDVVSKLAAEPEPLPDSRPRIAFIGKPNVGKSSLTNALLGKERSIVTEISGTTRDIIDSALEYKGQEIVLVDTAGLRKRARIKENVEFYAALRTERAIRECDVAVLILDAEKALESQDIRVIIEAETLNKGLVIAVNKWDLLEKDSNTAKKFTDTIHDRLKTLSYVPVIYVSALTKQRIQNLLDLALEVVEERKRKVPTAKLNEVVLAAVQAHNPPTWRNQYIRIKYATQVKQNPPVFALFCNHPTGIAESYRRYLENKLRDAFGFTGVPITLTFRKK